MNQTAKKMKAEELAIMNVTIAQGRISAEMSDGRTVSIPIAWFPKLSIAHAADQQAFEISPSGYGIHWSTIDEDISIKSFLF